MAKNLRRGRGNGASAGSHGSYREDDADQRAEEMRASNRATIIQKACREVADLEAERKRIGQEIAEVKQKLVKGDLGFKIADFNLAYRLYKLEDEDRDTAIDTMKEMFGALGLYGVVDWVDAVARHDAEAANDADPPEAA